MPVGEIKEFVRCLCILALKGEKLQLWAFLHIYATYCSSETHDRSRELPMGDSTNWDFCITCLQACLLPDVSLNTTCSNCLIDQSLQVEKCRSWQDMRHVTNTICTVTGYVLGDRIYTLARSNNAQNGHDLWVPAPSPHPPPLLSFTWQMIGLYKFHVQISILSETSGFWRARRCWLILRRHININPLGLTRYHVDIL